MSKATPSKAILAKPLHRDVPSSAPGVNYTFVLVHDMPGKQQTVTDRLLDMKHTPREITALPIHVMYIPLHMHSAVIRLVSGNIFTTPPDRPGFAPPEVCLLLYD